MNVIRKHVKIWACYFRLNLASALEYRASFLIQAFGMALSNCSFVFFWWIVFARIGGDVAGYSFRDVMFLWAVSSSGFGLTYVLFANTASLARQIVTSEFDVFLLQPCNVLLNVVSARTNLSAYGDFMYGLALMAIVNGADAAAWLWYLAGALCCCALLTAILLAVNTLTFFWGDSSMPAGFVQQLVINLTLYPDKIYGPPVRALMYSLLPVGFAVHTPLRLLNGAPLWTGGVALLCSVLFCALAARLFYLGLRRYESGNQIVTRL